MKTYSASGSGGMIRFDETGRVVDHTGWDYLNISRVDVNEYVGHYGSLADTDILLIGFWLVDGTYEPPCYGHRAEVTSDNHPYVALSKEAGK